MRKVIVNINMIDKKVIDNTNNKDNTNKNNKVNKNKKINVHQ